MLPPLEAVRLVRGAAAYRKDCPFRIAGRAGKLRRQAAGEVRVPGRDAGQGQHGRHHVKQFDRFLHRVTAPAAGSADDERHPCDRVIQRARPLLDQPVVPRPVPMVGEEQDRRLLGQPAPFQGTQQLAQ